MNCKLKLTLGGPCSSFLLDGNTRRMVEVAAVHCVFPPSHTLFTPLHCEGAVVAVLHVRSVRFGESRNVPRAVRGAFLKEPGFSPLFICPNATLLHFCLFALKMKNSEDKII